MTSVSHIGLLQLDERGVTTHLARLVYLPGKMRTFYDYFCVYNYLKRNLPKLLASFELKYYRTLKTV